MGMNGMLLSLRVGHRLAADPVPLRHGRACVGHARLFCVAAGKTWMAGPSPIGANISAEPTYASPAAREMQARSPGEGETRGMRHPLPPLRGHFVGEMN